MFKSAVLVNVKNNWFLTKVMSYKDDLRASDLLHCYPVPFKSVPDWVYVTHMLAESDAVRQPVNQPISQSHVVLLSLLKSLCYSVGSTQYVSSKDLWMQVGGGDPCHLRLCVLYVCVYSSMCVCIAPTTPPSTASILSAFWYYLGLWSLSPFIWGGAAQGQEAVCVHDWGSWQSMCAHTAYRMKTNTSFY